MSERETVMFEGTGMTQPPEPSDDLERMFAAEETAITDDGFTARVMENAHSTGLSRRRTIIYSAGMTGFGAAVAGIIEMAPHLPTMTGWWPEVSSALQSAPVTTASSPLLLVAAALVAGASFLAVAVAMQER